MEVIDLILRDGEARGTGLTDQEVDLSSEILKILFNLTVTVDRNNFDEVRGTVFLHSRQSFLQLSLVLSKIILHSLISSPEPKAHW